MISVNIGYSGPLKVTAFWKKFCDPKTFVSDVSDNNESLESNLIVDVENWQKFDSSNIFMNGFIAAIYRDLTWRHCLGRSWFKCNKLGLALSVTLKFNDSLTIVLNVKARKLWGLHFAFEELPKFREISVGE